MPEDLVQWQGFVDGQWARAERFANATAELPMVLVIGAALGMQGLRYNCAVVVAGGAILGVVPKEKLPTYNIFYEGRTISRGLAPRSRRDQRRALWRSDLPVRFRRDVRSRSARTSGVRRADASGAAMPARSWSATSPARPSGSASRRRARS